MTEDQLADTLTPAEWLKYTNTGRVPIYLLPRDLEALETFLTCYEPQIASGKSDSVGTLWALLGGTYESVMKRKANA